MNTAPCNCGTQTARPSVNERPRYYARQLITPDDLTLEQDFFINKLRRHNRFLHGWGVVCGADVVRAAQPWQVIVKTGYVLGPYGDEIYIEKDRCLDVRRKCTPSQPQMPPDDYECTEYQPPPPPAGPLFIAVRYVENKTRLIRVPLGGCGCEENACEYSRFSDAYELCVLDHCPDSHINQPGQVGRNPLTALECPACPTEPWVVLGACTVDDDGTVEVRVTECRRRVGSYDHQLPRLLNVADKQVQPEAAEPAAEPLEAQDAAPPPAVASAPPELAPE